MMLGSRSQARAPAWNWTTHLPLALSLLVNIYVIHTMLSIHMPVSNRQLGSLQAQQAPMLQRTLYETAFPAKETEVFVNEKLVLVDHKGPLLARSGVSLTNATPEVWASGTLGADSSVASAVEAVLTEGERKQLVELCGRCLHQTITHSVEVRGIGENVFVATGDIPDEWIRDGSVQLAVYLPRLSEHPVLRPIIEGAIRTQAYFILSDPWANSYRSSWIQPDRLGKFERQIGRGGWIATRNFEVDSGAYFINLLWNYASTPGLWAAASFLNCTLIHDAVALMLDTWATEQHHEEQSPYRYAELPREGRGPKSGYTGMIWSGFRPSDDPNTYSYNVPVNMYAAGALERLVALNERVWRDPVLGGRAARMAEEIRAGIDKHGVVEVTVKGAKRRIYAYEVDGLGGVLASFDDPNIPSLLSIPVLGYSHYDPQIYQDTRATILSSANSHFFAGRELQGCGSPHTPHDYVWSLAHCVQGLTTTSIEEKVKVFRQLLKMQGNNGLMHESNDVNNPSSLTRPLFQWANTMFVVYYEQTFGKSCSQAAEELRTAAVAQRESREKLGPRNGGPDLPAYYDRLEQSIPHSNRQ